MRFDLKTPCKNCPFRTDETAIRFACRERAVEIEETAYRWGFPCHLSAEFDEDAEDAGYEFADDGNTQHCAGALLMYLHEGESSTPGCDNDEALFERLAERMDWDAPVFHGIDDFLDANTPATQEPK